ncbi:hypothetical protein niasHT_029445 [Heterodera trifolii]|uniref:Phosphoribosyltransferase domain-containing protein n=1 Tax=Heterodera trifolii TaxID=157864 RepID=A0ABD2KQK0_9BILA
MIDAIQRHLEQNNGQLAHVLTPDHLMATRVGGQFSKSEVIGNVRLEIDAEIQRVEDPRQRALPSADQTKIIWLKDFPYMSPQQVVLALPNGGVPVAYEIAKSFNSPLGLLFTKTISYPRNEQIAIAAIADGNPPKIILKFLLNKRRPIPLEGHIVIVVDDGIATGLSAEAALVQLRDKKAAVVMLASPVCPLSTVEKFEKDGVKIVCLETPPLFSYVGSYYKHFDHVTDQEVISYLDRANEWMEQENVE